uniref:F-box domain-containing protein n=1 Tax=Acrobeloides nanus TaxID=290746 RepID=A0A914DT78_9BILA
MPSLLPLKTLADYFDAGKRKYNSLVSASKKSKRFPKFKSRKNRELTQISSTDENPLLLTEEIWSMVFDHCSPFDLLKMRQVNRNFKKLVQRRLNSLIYFDVVKCDLNEILAENQLSDGEFYRHSKSNLLLHLGERSAIVVVDDRWSSRDVYTVWHAVQTFSPYAHCVTLDVQIAELIIAGLSTVKLSRWYAFECYVQAVGSTSGQELHMKCSKTVVAKNALFPKLRELTIRSFPSDLTCLSRLADYGVSPDSVYNINQIELVRLNIVEMPTSVSRLSSFTSIEASRTKRPQKHLRIFKRWIGADLLKERYAQQYSQ